MGSKIAAGGGGAGLSQASGDARYLKIDGTTAGTGTQSFAGTVTSTTGVLASGVSATTAGQLRLFNTSNTRSMRITALAPAGGDRTVNFIGSALTATRNITVPNGDVDLTPLVTPTGTGNAVLATAPTISNPKLNGIQTAVRVVTGTDTATTADVVLACDATSAAFAETLPLATGTGQLLRIKKTDASINAVTVTAAGSDTIDGAATKALSVQNQSVDVVDYASGKWGIY